MTGFTVPMGFPYPQPADPLNVDDIQELAEAVEAAYLTTATAVSAAQSPGACKIIGGSQAVANNTPQFLTFQTAVLDNDQLSNLAVVNNSIGLRDNRRYILVGACTWAASTASYRRLELVVSGASVAQQQTAPSATTGAVTTNRVAIVLNGSIGQTVQLRAFQVTGADLIVQSCSLTAVQFDD